MCRYEKLEETTESDSNNFRIVAISTLLLFLYNGMEVMYGTYITTFAVKSDLHLTRQEGARVTAIFWGTFAIMRFITIFVAFKWSPLLTMLFSFTFSGIGASILAIAGPRLSKYSKRATRRHILAISGTRPPKYSKPAFGDLF